MKKFLKIWWWILWRVVAMISVVGFGLALIVWVVEKSLTLSLIIIFLMFTFFVASIIYDLSKNI